MDRTAVKVSWRFRNLLTILAALQIRMLVYTVEWAPDTKLFNYYSMFAWFAAWYLLYAHSNEARINPGCVASILKPTVLSTAIVLGIFIYTDRLSLQVVNSLQLMDDRVMAFLIVLANMILTGLLTVYPILTALFAWESYFSRELKIRRFWHEVYISRINHGAIRELELAKIAYETMQKQRIWVRIFEKDKVGFVLALSNIGIIKMVMGDNVTPFILSQPEVHIAVNDNNCHNGDSVRLLLTAVDAVKET